MRTVAALLFASVLHAADWISLHGAGVELVTDSGTKQARQVLERLEQIRAVVPAGDDALPLRVYLFARETDYRRFAPNATAVGFFQSGVDRDYIVLRAGEQMPRIVAHEYTHFAIHRRGLTRPAWLEEGLAEFYSNFDGRKLGASIPEHLTALRTQPWLTAEQLNAASEINERFYALSWALVHMLRDALPERITAAELDRLRNYKFRAEAVKVPLARSILQAEPVSELNALLLRGELAQRTGHVALAESFYTDAARRYPNSSSALLGLGSLTGDLAYLRRALELNDRDALAWLALGDVQKAAEINPDLGDARLLLGVRLTDDGNLPAALTHLQRAVELLPRKSYAWYSLGYALEKAGQHAAAESALESALRTATTPEQREMACALLPLCYNPTRR